MVATSLATIGVLVFSLVLNAAIPTRSDVPILRKPVPIENKGIYLSAYTAGWKARRAELVDLIERTELNTVVVDVKDSTGRVFFDSGVRLAEDIGAEKIEIPDLEKWLAELKQKNIYTIARVVVFQDPYLAANRPDIALRAQGGGIWRDYKGLSWVDPTEQLVWDYNIDVAKAAAEAGFDEINFDYIRFPSDGSIKQIVYAHLDTATYEGKSKVIAEFFRYLASQMATEPVLISADLFGMTLWRSDGMNIGQRFEDAVGQFDYISPMVYPSHYPPTFEGFANPAEHPYEIVYRSLIRGQDKINGTKTKIRPWLQDFDLGAEYTPAMITAQVQASNDAGGFGWLLWNASNRYTAENSGLPLVTDN